LPELQLIYLILSIKGEIMEQPPFPPVEEKRKRNTTLIIILVVLLLLCCCCVAVIVVAYQFGDQILEALNATGTFAP
jgi:hypothetical protein